MQGVTNVSSLGNHTPKEYNLYVEVNKNFLISRDVIFLESSKIDNVVEWQLNHLDRFKHANYFQDFDNEIPHILLLALYFLWISLKKSGWRKFLPLLCQERAKRLLAVGSQIWQAMRVHARYKATINAKECIDYINIIKHLLSHLGCLASCVVSHKIMLVTTSIA